MSSWKPKGIAHTIELTFNSAHPDDIFEGLDRKYPGLRGRVTDADIRAIVLVSTYLALRAVSEKQLHRQIQEVEDAWDKAVNPIDQIKQAIRTALDAREEEE